jgi:putative redox protein
MTKPKHVVARWNHRGLEFSGEGSGKVAVMIDGDNAIAPGPMEALALALATCSGADIIGILQKKRIDLKDLTIEIVGERKDDDPKRYTSIAYKYIVVAPGAKEQAVRQAIDLSLDKYCSVRHSLHPDIAVTYELALRA